MYEGVCTQDLKCKSKSSSHKDGEESDAAEKTGDEASGTPGDEADGTPSDEARVKKPDGRDTADQQSEEVEHVSPSSDAKSFEPLSTVQRPQSTAPLAVQQDKDAGILVSQKTLNEASCVFSLLFTLRLWQRTAQAFRGKDQSYLGQLLHPPWQRQLALCEDNEHGQLPGIDAGGDPTENLLWSLVTI